MKNPAEAFAKGGNSDEHQESVLNPISFSYHTRETLF